MRVLIVITTRFKQDGITNSVMNHFRNMDKSDMIIDFVTINKIDEKSKKEITSFGGQVYELEMRNSNPFKYIRTLSKIAKEKKYNIIHAHGNSCTLAVEMIAGKLGGIPIRIAHSRNTKCNHKIFNVIFRPLFNLFYTKGFACSMEAGRWLFKNDKFTVIKNANDIDKFRFNQSIRDKFREDNKLHNIKAIGHVGNFNYQKNHDFIIDIFNELLKLDNSYKLFLVGDGVLRTSIEDKVKDLGIESNVVFTGNISNVNEVVQGMDIMILPSHFEGLPNVVIEWQISSLPCIIADNITREVKLTDLVNFMPLADGAKKWAEQIHKTKLINRTEKTEEVLNQITAAGFNIKDNVKKIKALYRGFIEESK